jgi:hypothetical protein
MWIARLYIIIQEHDVMLLYRPTTLDHVQCGRRCSNIIYHVLGQ